MMFRILVLAIALYGAAAVPLLEGRVNADCVASAPTTADPDTVNKVYLAALERNADMRVLQATFETCLQESGCNNLKCGDKDSLGAFQQRPSAGWGTPDEIQNVTYAAGKFIEQAISIATAHPEYTPNEIAQGVQRAEADLYAHQLSRANQLIQQAAQATGKTAPGSGSSGALPPPSSGGCENKYTAVAGDFCSKIAQMNGISVAQFQQMNPSINSDCMNIMVDTAYCV